METVFDPCGRRQESCPASSIRLFNDELDLTLGVPGAPGTYYGTRFSWAGIISQVTMQGHRVFGPWRPGELAPDEHDNVTGPAGEFGMGIAGMPPPLGFDEAVPGGLFVKIGVGVLRRPDETPYGFARRYELVNSPCWQVQAGEQRVGMRQILTHDGYGYDYEHSVELVPGQPSFITRHVLSNTGLKPIRQTHYSHNFLVVDQLPVGPEYDVTFSFAPVSSFGTESAAYFEERTLKFREPLTNAVFSALTGFGGTAADNRVTVRNHRAGIEVRITGDCPVVRYHFFAAPGAVCPEPFVDLCLEPGASATWQHRYDLTCLSGESKSQ